jgi:ribosome-binding ATPase YchF (GTP1/OBG family)
MALSVGIVGLPGAGKTTLFNALTGAGAGGDYGKEHVGMASVADERLDQVAEVVGSARATPAAIRVVDVPGTGAQLLGNLRQTDAILAVLDGFSPNADTENDLETLRLELQVADRDHVERRLERVRKEAKSGEAAKRAELARLEELLQHVEGGASLAEAGELPAELEPLTTKPLLPIVNGPQELDAKLELELAELRPEEAAAFRDGRPSALADVVRRLTEALDLISFFTASENEARAWTLRRGQTALEAAETIHSDIARGFIRAEVIRWDDLVRLGSHAKAAAEGLQRLEGKTYVVCDGDVLNVRFNI